MSSDADLAMALLLEEQDDLERQAYTYEEPIYENLPAHRSVANEELELIDPTPDVHALFVQFNRRFFWGRLTSVVVRWSKKMYSCAGLCRYDTRAGYCDIALSEPLLKLRPRKDLIETLLHEMIHAYLFVVCNDMDREGHGPIFQHHMRRINREANVNITIRHTFNDEVRYYQAHWWRCTGVCQHQAPYFGFVRRSANRAPGPHDRWWARHRVACGGTFIKIKEPSKDDKKKSSKKEVVNEPGITKYFPTTKNKRKPNEPTKNTTHSPKMESRSTQTRRINTSVTFLDEKVTDPPKSNNSDVAATVRNHWANKYPEKSPKKIETNEATTQTAKSALSDAKKKEKSRDAHNKEKTKVIENTAGEVVQVVVQMYDCPVCKTCVNVQEINEHLDVCLGQPSAKVVSKDGSSQVPRVEPVSENIEPVPSTSRGTSACPVCEKNIGNMTLDDHLENCLSASFSNDDFRDRAYDQSVIYVSDSDDEDFSRNNDTKYDKYSKYVQCPCCYELFNEYDINYHVEMCVDGFGDFRIG